MYSYHTLFIVDVSKELTDFLYKVLLGLEMPLEGINSDRYSITKCDTLFEIFKYSNKAHLPKDVLYHLYIDENSIMSSRIGSPHEEDISTIIKDVTEYDIYRGYF